MISWSDVQKRRLTELDAAPEDEYAQFEKEDDRDKAFQDLEKKLIKKARFRLRELRETHRRPALCRMESLLADTLNAVGFVRVITPTIMSRTHLAKMTIDENHPLFSQVFWLDTSRVTQTTWRPG